MGSMNATKARQNLYRLIQDVNDNHEPVVISGKSGDAVLVSGDDWRAIQETIYLNAIPGMVSSIQDGMAEPVENLESELDW
ncbi:MAG: type II toxin-antitoxin system Phd/YefM family antitoxin [Spirochaeta sp.]|jgi:antitoxin YefM|nr:type II toxin-antitoxin system Phd/YefM family antitoxin [Spirochaeta sp.]